MEQNKTSKYFKYAIGEIVLVMVGILLALQVNNWNEGRKDRKEEIRILTNIIIDLDDDISQYADDSASSSKRQTLMDSLYIALKSPELFSLNQFAKLNQSILYENLFNCQSATFDESMSDGSFKLIQNQSIRKSVLEYYKEAKLNKSDGHVSKLIYEVIYPTFYKSSARVKKIGSKKEIIAYLNQNDDYLAMVDLKYFLQNYQIGAWQAKIQRAKRCKNKIETELKKHD